MNQNIWLSGVMGLVVGDALGVPVEFETRSYLKRNPVKTMIGHGTYNQPKGTWSDDSSMTIATLDSLKNGYNLESIMQNFVKWKEDGKYTPYGNCFDIGIATSDAIQNYMKDENIDTCGLKGERDNGNGSLMRILPVCLYAISKEFQTKKAIEVIHEVSALTHAHPRSKIACGLYYFIIKTIIKNRKENLDRILQKAINEGFEYYSKEPLYYEELQYYMRIKDIKTFKNIQIDEIQSTGYVLHTLEVVVWCLSNSENYKDSTLGAVNLGSDTDTTAAITGSIAGVYYGYDEIPDEWISSIIKKEEIISLCSVLNQKYNIIN